MWKSFILIFAIFILPACSSLQNVSSPSPLATQPLLATATKRAEESLIVTEQARAGAMQTELAVTIVAQPTFTPILTLTLTPANLPSLTPISNSIPAGIGAFMDVQSDVLGSKYEIQNAYYFDRLEGREVQDLGALSLKREQEIRLSLEPGYYVLLVFAYWQIYGDVTYGFLVEVKE